MYEYVIKSKGPTVSSHDTKYENQENIDDIVLTRNRFNCLSISDVNLTDGAGNSKYDHGYNIENHGKCESKNLKRKSSAFTKTRKSKSIVFAHANIQSLRNKTDDVKLIDDNEDIYVFTISEPWLNSIYLMIK